MSNNINKGTKITIPSNDGINIFPRMLGMAKYMYIYEIDNGREFKLIEKRNNHFAETMQHLKTQDVFELIDDCAIIISAYIGKKGITRLQEKGMQLIFKKGKLEQALDEVSKNSFTNSIAECSWTFYFRKWRYYPGSMDSLPKNTDR